MSSKEKILESLAKAVSEYDAEKAAEAARKAVKAGIDPILAIEEGLSKGVRDVGEKFGVGEIFLPELVMAAEAMKEGINVLKALMPKGVERRGLGRIIIGTVKTDIHDIGKSIVVAMLEAAGLDVIDLGVDIPAETFIEKVKELKPDIVGMSALLTTSLPEMRKVIDALKEAELRGTVKIIVGGAPVTQEFADEIGADARGADAVDAVKKAKDLLEL